MPKEVIVIGSGLAGMSCATYLAKENYKVKVVEKNASYGGRLQSFSHDGFTFDAGPSWYWIPIYLILISMTLEKRLLIFTN